MKIDIKKISIAGTVLTIVGGILAGAAELTSKIKGKDANN